TFIEFGRADISGVSGKGFADGGHLVGNNLQAHLNALEKQMRDAAADLDFETAARLRDEIKRLKAAELAALDDPLAREEARSAEGATGKRKEEARSAEVRKGAGGSTGAPSSSGSTRGSTAADSKSLFQKPSLDDMGPGTDTERPLFRKPDLDEMGRDVAVPTGKGQSLFRKNTLDEMTVGRTEKPVTGKVPEKPLIRAKPGAGSYEDPAEEKRRKGRTKGKTGRPGR
ncbi:UvrB/UvrC motif-containing protein, partial [Sinorhizobium sp. 6-117]|uniref:UvrB/UvrC motif-containing protein n=1 Tax=Sinorhizobium sp. 6-117 TaxID=3049090 RepID=UPI0024C3EC44